MKMKTRIRKKLHPTGQLSIFAILIFQVLFVLFAMALNIALVVHDKINLQNSVDLAAYYGAMKQAEMMNTVAHVNYQIRQSWKLLTWRYRVLGSMAQTIFNPGSRSDTEHFLLPYKHPNSSRKGPSFFCLGHPLWGGFEGSATPVTDMICKDMFSTTRRIQVPRVVGTLGSFLGMLTGVRDMGNAINVQLNNQCNFYAYNSWLLGIMSFIHFRRDQAARKYMIHKLAKIMAGDTGHPHGTDLNGNSIAVGVKKTFEKNLSFINKKTFERDIARGINPLKQFNSLQRAEPTSWLMDQEFLTSGFYAHFHGTGAGDCNRAIEYVNHPPVAVRTPQVPTGSPSIQALNLINEIGNHGSWPCPDPNKCNPSAGLKKRREFIIFYSVKVELDYKNQIFLPFSQDIKLKAKAFAKPFGGRIGPDKSADPLLPNFVSSPPGAMDLFQFDKQFGPNYSRYPGDPYGLRSKYVSYYWMNHVRGSATGHKNVKHYYPYNYPHSNDPLARGEIAPGTGVIARKWELAAVAPDLFDITYFTILPYYTYTHFPKVQNLLGTGAFYIRGDLGTYKDGTGQFQGKSILYQVGYDSSPSKNVWADLPSVPRLEIPFFYKVKPRQLNLLLTGWNPPVKKYQSGDNDYEAALGKTNFAKCYKWGHQVLDIRSPTTKGKIANGCIYGGRTGYSVKMISEDFLRSFLNPSNPFPTGDPDWYQR